MSVREEKALRKSSSAVADLEAQSDSLAELKRRLQEAEDTLSAIRSGEIDALVILQDGQEKIRTFDTADRAYRLVVEHMPQGAVLLDETGVVLYANGEMARLAARPLSSLVASSIGDVIAPEFRPAFHDIMRRCGCGAQHMELELQRPSGDLVPAYVTLATSTEVEDIIAVFTDLTEQKTRQRLEREVAERRRAEAALRESEQRLQRVLETDAVGVIFFDRSGVVINANHVFFAMTGYTRAEVEARELDWRKMTPPEWVAASEAQMEKFAATGRVGPYEKEYFLKDGTRKWMLFAGRDLGDGTIVEFCVDIDDRKRAEEALHERERELRRVQQIGRIGNLKYAVGAASRAVYTPEYLALHGLPADHPGETREEWLARVHPEDRERADRKLSDALEGRTPDYVSEYRVIWPSDGSVHWIMVRGEVDHDPATEGPITLRATQYDVSAQRTAEAALRESEARLRASEERTRLALEGTNDGVWDWNLVTEEVYHSPRFAEMLGYSPEEWTSSYENWIAHMHPDDVGPTQEALRRYMAGEIDEYAPMFRMRHKDGAWRWMLSRGRVHRDEAGRIVRMVGAHTDVTREKAAEDALAESKDRLQFALDAADLGAWDLDLATGNVVRSLRHDQMFGYAEMQPAWSRDIAEQHVLEEDRPLFREGIARAIETGTLSYDFRVRWPDGSIHVIAPRGHTSYDASGKAERMAGVIADITERKQQEEHLRLLTRELAHRSKNLLAVITAVIRQTAQRAESMDAFMAQLESRVGALSHAHDLLTEQDWKGAALCELIKGQLQPFVDPESNRVALSGPPLIVSAQATQNLALAIHELATNSVKHGALSVAEGAISIAWSYKPFDGNGAFSLHWTEEGGPPVTPPTRRGFGTLVLERLVPMGLNGSAALDYSPRGLTWTLTSGNAAFCSVPQ